MHTLKTVLLEETTDRIIEAFYRVYNKLGSGFLEKVYRNAMAFELTKIGLRVEQEKNIGVYYDGVKLGDCYADLLVNDLVIAELKASTHKLSQSHTYRSRPADEFWQKAEFKRKIFTNDGKKRTSRENPFIR